MAKKLYHINGEGKVSVCRATFRKCPYEDYKHESQAKAALVRRDIEANREAERERIRYKMERQFNEDNRIHISSALGGEYADKIVMRSQEMDEAGVDKSLLHLNADIYDPVIQKSRFRYKLSREPKADYEARKIVSDWQLDITANDISKSERDQEIKLNFNKEYGSTVAFLKDKITDVLSHSTTEYPIEGYEVAAARIVAQIQGIHAMIEEEVNNADEAAKILKECGSPFNTFKDSMDGTIDINVNRRSTSFRGEKLEEFLSKNEWFEDSEIGKMSVRVYDDENGESKSYWGVVYNETDGWGVETGTSKRKSYGSHEVNHTKTGYQSFDDADGLGEYVENFVSESMATNNEVIAEHSGQYAKSIMNDVNTAFKSHEKKYWNEVNGVLDEVVPNSYTRRQEPDQDRLYEVTREKNTANTIFDMFSPGNTESSKRRTGSYFERQAGRGYF